MLEGERIGVATVALFMGSLAAVGIGLARARAARRVRSRRNPAEAFLGGNDGRQEFTEDNLYGLGHVPWTLWGSLAFLAGALLAYHLVRELAPVLVIWGVAGVLISRLVRACLITRRQADIDRQVRDFVSLVWRALALSSEPGPALNEIAKLLRPGLVHERLQFHLECSYALDPAHILERLARDLRAVELEGLALGVRAAARADQGYQAIALCSPRTLTCRCSHNACLGLTPVGLNPSATYPWQTLTGPTSLCVVQAVGEWAPTYRRSSCFETAGHTHALLAPTPYPRVEL